MSNPDFFEDVARRLDASGQAAEQQQAALDARRAATLKIANDLWTWSKTIENRTGRRIVVRSAFDRDPNRMPDPLDKTADQFPLDLVVVGSEPERRLTLGLDRQRGVVTWRLVGPSGSGELDPQQLDWGMLEPAARRLADGK